MSNLVTLAQQFAIQSHQRIDQRRKYTGQPYEVHLKAVAELVQEVSSDPDMIAAAWLHDTVEDTPTTIEDIEDSFGSDVATLVGELTDVSNPGDGNRAARKSIDRAHLARACVRAKTVKLADLIDNCRDICKHDPRFARVFVLEMVDLLQVLTEGDARLHARAVKLAQKSAVDLGVHVVLPGQGPEVDEPPELFGQRYAKHQRVLSLFTRAFTAQEIAQPLRCFGAARDGNEVAAVLLEHDLEVAGILRAGAVVAYVRSADLDERRCGAVARSFGHGQLLAVDASLTDVISVLTRHDHCFVAHLDQVTAFVGRDQMQSPVVRMWLFGLVTFVEMELTALIRSRWPAGEWQELLPQRRLQKAQTLFEERRRRGQHPQLLDCLQLPDKSQLLAQDADELEAMGFRTRGAAKRVFKDLESLRNNLAHAQDIISHDWAQIARLSRRLEELTTASFGENMPARQSAQSTD